MMMITGTARVVMKLLKLNPDAAQMRIFGGSPMSVAVPPILLAKMTGIMSAIGFILMMREIWRATGVIRITVVTLSRNADRTDVVITNKVTSFARFPPEILKSFSASHSKIHVSDNTQTMIIIPVSRAITS